MDHAIATILRRRGELQAELAEIEAFLRTYHRYGGAAGDAADADASLAEPARDGPSGAEETRGSPPRTIADTALSILEEVASSVDRDELVRLVEARGLLIASADKTEYLLTILRRNRRGSYEFDGRGLRVVRQGKGAPNTPRLATTHVNVDVNEG